MRIAPQYSAGSVSWSHAPSIYVTCLQVLQSLSTSHELKAMAMKNNALAKKIFLFILFSIKPNL